MKYINIEMDYKKVIEIVEDLSDRGYPTYKKAKELVIEACEKQIAKEPIYSDYEDNGFDEIIPHKAECPVCGNEFEFGTWNDEDSHHCYCGQRIKWIF